MSQQDSRNGLDEWRPYLVNSLLQQNPYVGMAGRSSPYMDMTVSALSHRYLSSVRESPHQVLSRSHAKNVDRIVNETVELILERVEMKDKHLAQIDQEICEAGTRILQMDHWWLGAGRPMSRIRENAEREISALNRERRMEDIACWRDVSELVLALRRIL